LSIFLWNLYKRISWLLPLHIFVNHIKHTTVCDKLCEWLATSRWCSPDTPVSFINKTDRHNRTEILLKLALNTTTLTFTQQSKCIIIIPPVQIGHSWHLICNGKSLMNFMFSVVKQMIWWLLFLSLVRENRCYYSLRRG
jgi:hypothetical protein